MFFTPKTEAQKRKEAEEKRRRMAVEDDLIYSAGIFSFVDSDSSGGSSCASDTDFSSGFGCGD